MTSEEIERRLRELDATLVKVSVYGDEELAAFLAPGPGFAWTYDTPRGAVVVRVLQDGSYSMDQPNAPSVPRTDSGQTLSSHETELKNALSDAAKKNPLVATAISEAVSAGIDPGMFVAQIYQESKFNPSAMSPMGAGGIAQIMPDSARAGNVDVNDPAASLRYAAQRMAGALRKYNGDWDKALASYNAGEGAVEKYGGVPPYDETQQYVKIIQAMAQDPRALLGIQEVKAPPNETDAQRRQREASAAASLASIDNYYSQIRDRSSTAMDRDLSRPSEIAQREASALNSTLSAAKTASEIEDLKRKALPAQQRLLMDAYSTIQYIQEQIQAGTLDVAQADQYFTSVSDYVNAGLKGATPYELWKEQMQAETDRAKAAVDLLNQRISSGSSLAANMYGDYSNTLTANGGLLVNPGPYDPTQHAVQRVNDLQGDVDVSGIANALLTPLMNGVGQPGSQQESGFSSMPGIQAILAGTEAPMVTEGAAPADTIPSDLSPEGLAWLEANEVAVA